MKILEPKYFVIRLICTVYLSILCTPINSQNKTFESFKSSICRDTFITHYSYSGLGLLNPGGSGVNSVFDISLMPIQKTDSAVYILEPYQAKSTLQLIRKTFSNSKIEKYQLNDNAFTFCGFEKENSKIKSNILSFPFEYGSFRINYRYDTLYTSSNEIVVKQKIDSIWIDAKGTLVRFQEQFPVLRQKTISRIKLLKYHLMLGSWVPDQIKEETPYIVYRYWNELHAEPIGQLMCSYEGTVLYATYNAPRSLAN